MEKGEAHQGWSRLLCAPGELEAMLGQGSHTYIVRRKTGVASPKMFPFMLLGTRGSQGYSAGETQHPTAQQALMAQDIGQRVVGALDFGCPGSSLP